MILKHARVTTQHTLLSLCKLQNLTQKEKKNTHTQHTFFYKKK